MDTYINIKKSGMLFARFFGSQIDVFWPQTNNKQCHLAKRNLFHFYFIEFQYFVFGSAFQ